MKLAIPKILFCIILIFGFGNAMAQIDDIKKKSKENKGSKSNNSSFLEKSTGDFGSGCVEGAFSCCFNNGVALAFGLIAKNHKSIMNLMENDPTILSFEARANFALGWHYSKDINYFYVNYLPGVRGNLGAFATDFRFNVLTEYTDGFPNSFTSWEWLFLFNIEPVQSFKLSFGTGIQNERFSDSYFNEHYIGFRFGLANNSDYIDANTRFSVDYLTSEFPFFEGGVHYQKRIAEFNNAYMYITLGGIYQNYYSSHDIWALQGGLIINVH
ncbi:MAG: hypothetical protein ABFS35_03965 [Bacteroidota bacterium]